MEGKHDNTSKKRKPRSSSETPAQKRKRPENREPATPSALQTSKDTNSSENTTPSSSQSHSNLEKNGEVNNNKKEVNSSQQSDNSSNDPPSQDTSVKAIKDENSQRTASDTEPDLPQASQSTEPSPTATQSIDDLVHTQISTSDKSPDDQPKEDTSKRIKFSDQGSSRKGNSRSSPHKNDPQTSGRDSSMSRRRRRCIYGAKCYRRSSDHLAEFSHPGDADYDIKDTRPVCKYGSSCYRTSAKHRSEYSHKKPQQKRTSTVVRPQYSDDESEASSEEESVDESEYEPSGLDESSDDGEDYESDA